MALDIQNMTKCVLITGTVYTKLKPNEVRQYMQGGNKTRTIPGFLSTGEKIILSIDAIEYVYE